MQLKYGGLNYLVTGLLSRKGFKVNLLDENGCKTNRVMRMSVTQANKSEIVNMPTNLIEPLNLNAKGEFSKKGLALTTQDSLFA